MGRLGEHAQTITVLIWFLAILVGFIASETPQNFQCERCCKASARETPGIAGWDRSRRREPDTLLLLDVAAAKKSVTGITGEGVATAPALPGYRARGLTQKAGAETDADADAEAEEDLEVEVEVPARPRPGVTIVREPHTSGCIVVQCLRSSRSGGSSSSSLGLTQNVTLLRTPNYGHGKTAATTNGRHW